jgi:hypothetical protein
MMGGIFGCGLTHRPPTAEILDNRNLVIWDAAIHCTLVALDIAMVELCCTLAYKLGRNRLPRLGRRSSSGGAGHADCRTADTALVGSQMT